MNTALSIRLMNRFIDKLTVIDSSHHLTLQRMPTMAASQYEINGPDRNYVVYVYCDNLYCSLEWRNFKENDRDTWTLTEGNLDEVANEIYLAVKGVH